MVNSGGGGSRDGSDGGGGGSSGSSGSSIGRHITYVKPAYCMFQTITLR